jgi:hypothetical protein
MENKISTYSIPSMVKGFSIIVYFSESIHPVSFQTVQPDQGFFFLAASHPVGSIAA